MSKILFFLGKNGGEILTGYTFRAGYTYCADCKLYSSHNDLLPLNYILLLTQETDNLCVMKLTQVIYCR
jgi:hypothetical protein